MATSPSQDKPSFFKTGDAAQRPATTAGATAGRGTDADKPTSLYKPRPTSAFAAGAAGKDATQRPFSSLRTGAQTTTTATAERPASRFSTLTRTTPPATQAAAPRPATTAARPVSLRTNTGGEPTPSPTSAFRSKTDAQAPRATSPFRKDLQISDEEFLLLRDFIYQQCGIFIAENR